MLVASLDPEIYLKSERTQRRMVAAVNTAITSSLGSETEIQRLPGHRLAIEADRDDTAERLTRIFGIRAVEHVEQIAIETLDQLAGDIAQRMAPEVQGRTFAVRPNRMGTHDWTSQDLAIAAGSLLVEAGGRVDLSHPEVTVRIRIVSETAYLTLRSTLGQGGLPPGTQGRALMLFSGGIDSPVAAYLMASRGVALDYLHFSLGCGQADHAAGIAHLLYDRYGAGTDPNLHIVELEPVIDAIQRRTASRERQMALKGAMYLAAAGVAGSNRRLETLVTGEAIGQVSTQTLTNLSTLDRVIDMPVLRPLVALDKATIMDKAGAIGTLEVSSRTRETCDISGGARVSVGTSLDTLQAVLAELQPSIDDAVTTAKTMKLRDWIPGS
jgi:thiamine biosynthesis protein ThiI